MISFEKEKFDNFINSSFEEVLEYFEQSPDISDERNYWFFDNEKQDILFISYFDGTKVKDINIIRKEDEVFIEKNVTSIGLKASLYSGYTMYQMGFPLLLLNANPKGILKKNVNNIYDLKSALDIFIEDNPDFDLEETKLIIFLLNEGRDYYTTTIQLPSKYKAIMKELKLKEKMLEIPDLDYLSEQYRIPFISLSIGYYDFNRQNERVNYLDLEDMIKIAYSITELLETVEKENIQFDNIENENDEFDEEESFEDFEEDEFEEDEENEDYDEDYDEYEDDDKDEDEDEDEDEDY